MKASDPDAKSAFGGAYAGKRVFVTGHTGFKGGWLCEWLLGLGAEVTGFSLKPPTEPALFDQLGLAARLRHQLGDVRDRAALSRALTEAKADYVFHLAAQPIVRDSYARPVETFEVNLMGTVNVLEALRSVPHPCSAVFITTDKCYENREWLYGYREEDPLGGYDPYSASKATAELAINSYRRSFFQSHPVRIASARAGNVIGGGDWALDRIVPDCMRALEQKQPIGVRNPKATRPWQHVLEPLSGYLWLGAVLGGGGSSEIRDPRSEIRRKSEVRSPKSEVRGEKAEEGVLRSEIRDPRSEGNPKSEIRNLKSEDQFASAFNFGPGHESNRTVAELVAEVLKHWPGRWEDMGDPKAVHEANLLQLATDKAHALLGWAPVWDFPMAIEQTVKWYRSVVQGRGESQAAKLTRDQIAAYTARAVDLRQPWAFRGKA
jgi:CDP-glucose 4,6-dehydratase